MKDIPLPSEAGTPYCFYQKAEAIASSLDIGLLDSVFRRRGGNLQPDDSTLNTEH